MKWQKMSNPNPQGIKLGDFVVGYHAGVHKVERVQVTYEKGDYRPGTKKLGDPHHYPQIHYRQIMDSDFDKPYSRRPWKDPINGCTKVDSVWVDNLEKQYAERIARLRILVAGNWAVANSIPLKSGS